MEKKLQHKTHVEVTEEAKQKIRAIQSHDAGKVLRVAVTKGGCAGFKYELSIAEPIEGDVTIVESGEPLLAIEESSVVFLEDCQIDFHRTLMKGGFVIKNQNESISCSCGSSFRYKPSHAVQ